MKTVSVYDAEGMVLCHDITQIVPGQFKGAAFKKGHIVTKEDIPHLLNMGKKNIFVWDLSLGLGLVHEDEAALRIAKAIRGGGLKFSSPNEGKVVLTSMFDGLLKINVSGLEAINSYPEVMAATLHTNQRVSSGKTVGGTRIIPLVIEEKVLRNLEEKSKDHSPIIEVKPFKSMNVGIITTGSEVYEGRIKDGFGPVLKKKIEESGSKVLEQVFVSDSADMITAAIHSMLEKGTEMILVTGGMSVDPDDVTPDGIRNAGGRLVSYGAPVLPGAMFLLSYLGNVPILGLPGCVMYSRTSIFDLIYARIQAGETLERKDIIQLGHGGLCLGCKDCRYPNCSFGK